MDPNDQARLQSAEREIEKYLKNPFTCQIQQANLESQKVFLDLIIDGEVKDIETLCSHFVMIGHLRGLRDSSRILQGTLDEIKTELENAK